VLTTANRRVVAFIAALGLLSGCGYTYTADSQCKVVFHVPPNRSNSNPETLVSFRVPIIDPHHAWDFFPVVPSSDSRLEYLTPIYHWGPTIVFIPPLGKIPGKPPKPIFLIKRANREFWVGPSKDYGGILARAPRHFPATTEFLPSEYRWNPHLSGSGSLAGWQIDVNLPR
jgi:hypothetical protein